MAVPPRDWSSLLMPRPRSWRRTMLGIGVAIVGSVLSIVFVTATDFPFESLPFVLVILAATLVGRRIAAAVAVLVSTVLLDYYVQPPLRTISPQSAPEFWGLVAFAAVALVAAQVVAWLEGVGDRERIERERTALLVHAGDAVSSASGVDRALQEMARVLVPGFADWAVVHVARDDGTLERAAAVHAAGGEIERALREAPEIDPRGERGAAAVIRTGRSERFVAPSIDELRSMTVDEDHLRVVTRAGIGSSIVAPLIARDRTFGALTVVRSRRRPTLSETDRSLVEEIAERGALVVDNLRLVEMERRSATLSGTLQQLTSALSASVTPTEVGRTVVEQGVAALGAVAAVFAIRLPDGEVELRESFGHPSEAIDLHRFFPLDAPLPLAQAMRTGRAVVVRNLAERDRRFPAMRGIPPANDHALACVPFVVRGSAIGGLAVTFAEPRSFAPWEIAFMESIAAQAGQALDRAMLFESERSAYVQLEASTDRLERLLMVAYRLSRVYDRRGAAQSVVDGGVRAAGASSGALMLVDESTDELVLEASSGLDEETAGARHRVALSAQRPSAEAARTGHPVWVESPEARRVMYPVANASAEPGEEAPATAALPLVVAGRRLGVLALDYAGEHGFGDEERDFLLTLAGLCGQSLQGVMVLEERESARAEAEEARERIAFLAEATRLLSGSLEYETALTNLANLCVPRIADWISVSVVEGAEVRQLVLRHQDREKLDLVEDLQARHPFDPGAASGLAKVLRDGESELYERVDDELLKRAAPDEETLEALRRLGLTSAATVPLAVQDRVLGALTLAYAESGRHYDGRDLTFLESLARRAAVAIENARLFSDREQMARALQRSLLPRRLPPIPGANLAVRYIPFGRGNDVGGDFYDVFAGIDDSWGLMIGDVCGKGAEAAAIVGIARHTVRGLAMAHSRPSSILEALNRAILDESPWDRFCTACYVRLRPADGGFRATVALGGHLPPYVLSPDGNLRQVGEPGSLLGVLEQPELTDAVVDLGPGDLLLLYTDGLEEPSRDAERGSVEAALAASAGRSVDEVADALLERFRGQGGSAPRDDVALLALKVSEPE